VAKKVKVIIVDDIDGTEGDGIVTHRFSLGSDFYEIDLCPQNLLSLRAALEPFVSAGRRVRIGNRRKPEPAPRQQNNSALDFSRQQRLAAAPRPQGNSALDFSRQQRLAAAPRPQGNSALDFSRQQRLAIRKWARDNGYDVADRRAFSQEVLAAYREASGEAEAAR
jgi:Lsr2